MKFTDDGAWTLFMSLLAMYLNMLFTVWNLNCTNILDYVASLERHVVHIMIVDLATSYGIYHTCIAI